jgi:hypothetical protein
VLTVNVDRKELIAQPFYVEHQHNFVGFWFDLSSGRHDLDVVSDTGAELHKQFAMPETGRRYAVLTYWYYRDTAGRFLDWDFSCDHFIFG